MANEAPPDALDPEEPDKKRYTKISGNLINSHFSGSEYIAVVGVGICGGEVRIAGVGPVGVVTGEGDLE